MKYFSAGFFGALLVSALIVFSGCAAAPSFKAADCERYRYPDFNVLVCSDNAVDSHCRKWIYNHGYDAKNRAYIKRAIPGMKDNGKPVGPTDFIAGCAHKRHANLKGNAIVGRSNFTSVLHEIAHLISGKSQADVERGYPRVGVKR